MNLTVNQSILIQNLKIGSIINSSVLQIGAAGLIKPLSKAYNTGQFTGPAPELQAKMEAAEQAPLLVPFARPS